jgi:hypothetical protein
MAVAEAATPAPLSGMTRRFEQEFRSTRQGKEESERINDMRRRTSIRYSSEVPLKFPTQLKEEKQVLKKEGK